MKNAKKSELGTQWSDDVCRPLYLTSTKTFFPERSLSTWHGMPFAKDPGCSWEAIDFGRQTESLHRVILPTQTGTA